MMERGGIIKQLKMAAVISLAVLMAVFPAGCAEKTEAEEGVKVRLVAVGDLLIHKTVSDSGIREDGSRNYDHLFKMVKEEVASADVAVINNEVIFGGNERGYSDYPRFNAFTEAGDAEVNAGFDIILSATNHVMDQGIEGIENCLDFWKKEHNDIQVLGIHASEEDARDIYVYEKDGFRIAMLNYTYGLNGNALPEDRNYMVDLMTEETKDKIVDDIRRAHDISDAVVVFPHWGTEYSLEPDTSQREWAQLFADEGVTLVIGTHPHVIEPVEWYTGKNGGRMLCFYSLGNYISMQTKAETMLGIMADVTLCKKADGTVEVAEYDSIPVVTHISAVHEGYTTYKLSQYSEELASDNVILRYDDRFSKRFLEELVEKVLE